MSKTICQKNPDSENVISKNEENILFHPEKIGQQLTSGQVTKEELTRVLVQIVDDIDEKIIDIEKSITNQKNIYIENSSAKNGRGECKESMNNIQDFQSNGQPGHIVEKDTSKILESSDDSETEVESDIECEKSEVFQSEKDFVLSDSETESEEDFVPKLFVRKLFDDGDPLSPINAPHEVSSAINISLKEKFQKTLPGIQIDTEQQIRDLKQLRKEYEKLNITWQDQKTEKNNFYYENQSFSYLDSQILASFLAKTKPKKIIAFVDHIQYALFVDILEKIENYDYECLFIEPDPNRLKKTKIPLNSRHRIMCRRMIDISLTEFETLEKGDFLFTDTTHVAKAASDVCQLFMRVLPILKEGVFIHLHDVFWPFEYPAGWLREGRSWNEAYLIRCFLQFNNHFRIIFFADFLYLFEKQQVEKIFPDSAKNSGGSLYLLKQY